MVMSVEMRVENRFTRRKTCAIATLSTTNLTLADLVTTGPPRFVVGDYPSLQTKINPKYSSKNRPYRAVSILSWL